MKKVNRYKKGIVAVIAAFLITLIVPVVQSCDDFTEVDLPASQLAANAVFQDNTTATAALLDIYAKIRNTGLLTGYPNGLSHQMGLYADELVMYGGDPSFYNNNVLPTASDITQLWNSSYYQIYAANALLQGTTASTSLTAQQKEILQGEALFVRALIHFYLYNTFGDIPYITTTDYQTNSTVHRMNRETVFQYLYDDIDSAVSLLPENYTLQDRTRPNRAVALALKARLNLYNEQWQQAADAASALIGNSLYQLTPVEQAFLNNATATLWQLSPELNGGNTLEAGTFTFFSGPPPLSALSQELYDTFEEQDLRKQFWIGSVTDGTQTWYYPAKYDQVSNSGTSIEYSVMFRIPEIYLIRAEAQAHLGNLNEALQDLNTVRNNAGIGNIQTSSQEILLTAIAEERKRELFTELGHRFFDLKRTGKLNEVLTPLKPGWESTDAQLPLPEAELLLNTNLLPQNTGY